MLRWQADSTQPADKTKVTSCSTKPKATSSQGLIDELAKHEQLTVTYVLDAADGWTGTATSARICSRRSCRRKAR